MYHPCDTLAADLADSTFSADRLRPHLGACGGLSGREEKVVRCGRALAFARRVRDAAPERRGASSSASASAAAAQQPDAGTRPRRRRARLVLVKEGTSHGRRGRAPRASRAASSLSAAQSLVILKLRAARAAAALGSLSTPLERRSQQTAGPAR